MDISVDILGSSLNLILFYGLFLKSTTDFCSL